MSKETKKIYGRLIDEATHKIVYEIISASIRITDEVQRDLMLSVKAAIESYLQSSDNKQSNQ